MKNVFAVSALFLALCSGGAHASSSVAAGLSSASYSQSGGCGATPQGAFNGGGWNKCGFGDGWIQVDLGTSMAINEVSFYTNQLPAGLTAYSVFVSDSAIGHSWSALSPVASASKNTSSGTLIDFQFTPASGRYVEILANGGPSWTAITNVNVQAVPEPETYALLLAGLGLVGAVGRRRKTVQA